MWPDRLWDLPSPVFKDCCRHFRCGWSGRVVKLAPLVLRWRINVLTHRCIDTTKINEVILNTGPVLCYGSVPWTWTRMAVHATRITMLSLYGPVQEKGQWLPRWNSLYEGLNIVDTIKIRRLAWAGHIIRTDCLDCLYCLGCLDCLGCLVWLVCLDRSLFLKSSPLYLKL